MLYSIIIPVFNVEKYLSQCINTVLTQSYKKIEIILINDNSSDNSLKICKEFAASDKRIKLINNSSNKGVSASRNLGIENSSGDYILFLDSDDFYSKDFLFEIDNILNIKQYDLIISKFVVKNERSNSDILQDINFDSEKINDCLQEDVLDYIYKKRMINTVWRFIIRSEIIKKNKLYFINNIIHEDEEWVPKLLCNCQSFYFYTKSYYTYRLREKSITSCPSIYNYKSYIKVADLLLSYAQREKIECKKNCYLRTAYKCCGIAYRGIKDNANPIKKEYD